MGYSRKSASERVRGWLRNISDDVISVEGDNWTMSIAQISGVSRMFMRDGTEIKPVPTYGDGPKQLANKKQKKKRSKKKRKAKRNRQHATR